MSWELAFPEILCLEGREKEEPGCFTFLFPSLVLARLKLLAPWLSEVFPFKDIGTAELSLPFLSLGL